MLAELLNCIMFSDEACCHFSGILNHNAHIWGSGNLHVYLGFHKGECVGYSIIDFILITEKTLLCVISLDMSENFVIPKFVGRQLHVFLQHPIMHHDNASPY